MLRTAGVVSILLMSACGPRRGWRPPDADPPPLLPDAAAAAVQPGKDAAAAVQPAKAPDSPGHGLPQRVVDEVMLANYRRLVPCLMAARRRQPTLRDVELDLVIAGTGQVRDLRVNGQRGGEFAACLRTRMQDIHFPPFRGSEIQARWSMAF